MQSKLRTFYKSDVPAVIHNIFSYSKIEKKENVANINKQIVLYSQQIYYTERLYHSLYTNFKLLTLVSLIQ